MSVTGRTALVVGARGAIGRAVVDRLVREGACVFTVDGGLTAASPLRRGLF